MSNFALAIEKLLLCYGVLLGYGVMVTLQILVLSFLVRVQIAQQRERSFHIKLRSLCWYSFLFIIFVYKKSESKGLMPSDSLYIELKIIFLYSSLIDSSITFIFCNTNSRSALSFSTLRLISVKRLFPFLEEVVRKPKLFS